MHWIWQRFADLGVDGLYDALALRCRVFILEQGPDLDPDGVDQFSGHLLGRDDSGTLQAYLRGESVPFADARIPDHVAPPVETLQLAHAPETSRIGWARNTPKAAALAAASSEAPADGAVGVMAKGW